MNHAGACLRWLTWDLSLLLFRWWLAALQCVTALQRLWFALQVLASCQMAVGAVRCVRHSSTRTAAPSNPVTTTKGWSVTTATMWRWPGVFVEVGRWRGKTTHFCGQCGSRQHFHWLDHVTLHIWEGGVLTNKHTITVGSFRGKNTISFCLCHCCPTNYE